ncbi:MAG: hypothetical protein JO126_05620 [Alphaproteobacteria bacterium]|nr:hypothetical protein [Alphaproteobacteria bacterium]MBV8548916.1 hypothetical protein [Alphaproteobacteria bacterium]
MPPRGHRARKLALFFLFAMPFFFGVLALWLGQDANWDLRNYHWYNAYAFLNGRYDVDLLPSQTPWFYNPTLDVPYYLLATHVPARVAAFILGAVQGINYSLLFMLCYAALVINNTRQKVIVSAVLALMGMLGGGGIALIGTNFGDNITSLGVFTSALLLLRYQGQLFSTAWWRAILLALLFGLPAGAMMGLKLPSVTFCVGLCGAIVAMRGPLMRRVLIAFGFGLGVLAGVALALGHWAHFLQTHFGSPLFPYFNQIFKSPLAPLSSARDTQFVTRSLHDFLLFPWVFTDSPYRVGEIEWRDWRLLALYILLPLGVILRLIFGKDRARADGVGQAAVAPYLMTMVAISYFVWLVMFCVYRYAVPLEMLAPLLIVLAIDLLPLRIATRQVASLFILGIIACSIQGGNWGRHQGWLDHAVEADIPPLGNTSNLMVLMAGFDPFSHVIPLFPPDVTFVRIQSNFSSPDENKGINRLIHDKVDSHKGRLMIMVTPWQHHFADDALSYFNLRPSWRACQKVLDRLYPSGNLDLCPVERVRTP